MLTLFSDSVPLNGNLVNANYRTNNSMWQQQVTSDWSVASTNWFNQPSVSSSNQISIATTSISSLNLAIDVTNMVSSMVNRNTNYGFLLRLQNETYIIPGFSVQTITQLHQGIQT